MLARVNKYLRKLASPRRWGLLRQDNTLTAQGLCCISVGKHEASLIYTPYRHGKIEITAFKTFSYLTPADFKIGLANAIDSLHLAGAPCLWLLDPSQYQLMLMEDLPVEPNEFQAAIRWKVKGLLPFPVEDAIIDRFYVPVQKTYRPQTMIMVVVARESYIHEIADQLKDCNLNLCVIDVAELALRDITAKFEDDELSSALVYCQHNYVDLIVTHKKELYLSRRIDFDIDALKSNSGENEANLQKLALEIQRSFDYFQSQWRLTAPSRVFFASSQVTYVDVITALSGYLTTPVKYLDLSQIITNTVGMSVEQQNKFLPLIGGLLREEIWTHAAN